MTAFLIFPIIFVATVAAYPACVPPDHKNFYWESPCQGQRFTNLIDVNTLTAMQKGVSVDANGGLNLTMPLDLTLGIVDNYGRVDKPLIDIVIQGYVGAFDDKCKWVKQPTFDALNNIDGCTIFPANQCHLEGNPTTLTASIDIASLLGDLVNLVTVGEYYGLAVTVKDADKPLSCVWAQDIVIAK